MARRLVRRSVLVAVGLAAALLVTLDIRHVVAQAEASVTPISWLGVSGIVALLGVAVVWGRLQEQARGHARQIEQIAEATRDLVPRPEVDRRLDEVRRETREAMIRIEAKLDDLWERRSDPR